MSAYLVFDVTDINDPDGLQQYREQARPLVEQYGGRYLVATDQLVRLEGNSQPVILAILEFDSLERLQALYDSPEYQPLKHLRQRSVTANLNAAAGL